MDFCTFVFYERNSWSWTLLHIFWWTSKIYATTTRVLFYLLCNIISEFYKNIRKELELLALDIPTGETRVCFVSEMSHSLKKLAIRHAQIYRCVEQLNLSFGHFLFIEITLIFFAEINTAMYILDALCSMSKNWLFIFILVIWLIYWLLNFSILCFSSHRIENEVYNHINLNLNAELTTHF